MRRLLCFFAFCALCLALSLTHISNASAKDDGLKLQTVNCGGTACDLNSRMCYHCEVKTKGRLTGINYWERTFYACWDKSTNYNSEVTSSGLTYQVYQTCSPAQNGGKGVRRSLFNWIDFTNNESGQCRTETFKQKYAYCYPCEIITILFGSFLTAASAAYGVTRQAANAILVVAFILWVAGFALKNVSSFTTVEPMKMLQDLFVQLFKVILAFVIINSGLQTILHYSLVPIMNAGTDFADAVLDTVADYTPQAFSYDDTAKRASGAGGTSSLGGGAGYSGGSSGGGSR